MAGTQHVDVQRRGVVGILYCTGEYNPFGGDIFSNLAVFQYAIPMKVVGLHACFEDERLGDDLRKIGYFLERSRRLRARLHFGSLADNQLALRSFGIPVAETRPPVFCKSQMLQRFQYWHLMQMHREITMRRQKLLLLAHRQKHQASHS